MKSREKARRRPRLRGTLTVAALIAVAGAGLLAWHEASTSAYQARRLSAVARTATFAVEPGPSDSIRFPGGGPFDRRLGYSDIPGFTLRLTDRGYGVTAQSRMSASLTSLVDRGLFAPYREKTQAGLLVLDCRGEPLHRARSPERHYRDASEIPALVAGTLAFIEDRELLANPHPTRNPAVDWGRLLHAGVDLVRGSLDPTRPQPGGSTLATQIEKYRHSSGGITDAPREKLRQIASASVRAYLDGPDTTAARRRVLIDYLNTVPLAARPGWGEVTGLGDGLFAWYGADFDAVNRVLANPSAPLEQRAVAYRQVLSLMIAHRRPTEFLGRDAAALHERTDGYLRVLATAGVIPATLRDAALRTRTPLRLAPPDATREPFVGRKAPTAARVEMSLLLGMPRLYDLDRLDAVVESTFDRDVQVQVTNALAALGTRAGASAAGLLEPRLLGAADPAGVTYSVALYEATPSANLVRVQTDNVDQPFDSTAGLRLDLGSTAKLRTLITYLEIVARLHAELAGLDEASLAVRGLAAQDPLTSWAAGRLQGAEAEAQSLDAFLGAALERTYSASPTETFWTGGGAHRFSNFDADDDGRTVTVREAFRRSVNLPFVRLMRDVVDYTTTKRTPGVGRLLDDVNDPQRREYLHAFAESEGAEFVRRFYSEYAGRARADAETLLVRRTRPTPHRLAAMHRYLEPAADTRTFTAWVRERLGTQPVSDAVLTTLYALYGTQRMSLADRAHAIGVHPLELWTVRYLREHPSASRGEAVDASRADRVAAYAWLFNTRSKSAQDARIRTMLERDAFAQIHEQWQRLGYPFQSISPSLGTALGSSADRPTALAELVGIIVNGGLRLPTVRLPTLEFATGTPYETHFARKHVPPVRVLEPEVAASVRSLLESVVTSGTAVRLNGAFRGPDGSPMPVGGKTGTGDHRVESIGRDGRMSASRVVSRSGTFVFFLGSRHFGTVTAYVSGSRAADYAFTSALPTQVLKSLAPVLDLALTRPLRPDGRCRPAVAAAGRTPAGGGEDARADGVPHARAATTLQGSS